MSEDLLDDYKALGAIGVHDRRPDQGEIIKIVTKTGWNTRCQFINMNDCGVTVRLRLGEKRFYPWSEIKCVRWDGPGVLTDPKEENR